MRCLEKWQSTLRSQGYHGKAKRCDICCARYRLLQSSRLPLSQSAVWENKKIQRVLVEVARAANFVFEVGLNEDWCPGLRLGPSRLCLFVRCHAAWEHCSYSQDTTHSRWVVAQVWQLAVLGAGTAGAARGVLSGGKKGVGISWGHCAAVAGWVGKWVPEMCLAGAVAPRLRVRPPPASL